MIPWLIVIREMFLVTGNYFFFFFNVANLCFYYHSDTLEFSQNSRAPTSQNSRATRYSNESNRNAGSVNFCLGGVEVILQRKRGPF